LHLHKITYNSACMTDRPEMFAPTRGFLGMTDSMEPCTMLWGRPLLPWKRHLGAIAHITRLVWQIDRRCLHLPWGFRGWPIQRNHAKCCRADPCCHGNEIWANLGYFSTKSPMSRLVCRIDQICLGLPAETTSQQGRSLLPRQRHLR